MGNSCSEGVQKKNTARMTQQGEEHTLPHCTEGSNTLHEDVDVPESDNQHTSSIILLPGANAEEAATPQYNCQGFRVQVPAGSTETLSGDRSIAR